MTRSAQKMREIVNDKKKANKIFSQLAHYAIYGTMIMAIAVTIGVVTQSQLIDPRSRARKPAETKLTLQTEVGQKPACYTTEKLHRQVWAGAIAAQDSFTLELPFCTDRSRGKTGFLIEAKGGSSKMTLFAESPNGLVYSAHKSDDILTQSRCVLPGTDSLAGGTWKVTLTNWEDLPQTAEIKVVVAQATSQWQQANCPPQDWNF